MTHTEFMKRINEITERGRAYAQAHAEEIRQAQLESEEKAAAKISAILENAKKAVKHSYHVYESYRTSISILAANSEQYETAMKDLAAILKV